MDCSIVDKEYSVMMCRNIVPDTLGDKSMDFVLNGLTVEIEWKDLLGSCKHER